MASPCRCVIWHVCCLALHQSWESVGLFPKSNCQNLAERIVRHLAFFFFLNLRQSFGSIYTFTLLITKWSFSLIESLPVMSAMCLVKAKCAQKESSFPVSSNTLFTLYLHLPIPNFHWATALLSESQLPVSRSHNTLSVTHHTLFMFADITWPTFKTLGKHPRSYQRWFVT